MVEKLFIDLCLYIKCFYYYYFFNKKRYNNFNDIIQYNYQLLY